MRSSTYGRGQQGLNIAMALFAEAKSALEIAWADASYAYGALVRLPFSLCGCDTDE